MVVHTSVRCGEKAMLMGPFVLNVSILSTSAAQKLTILSRFPSSAYQVGGMIVLAFRESWSIRKGE